MVATWRRRGGRARLLKTLVAGLLSVVVVLAYTIAIIPAFRAGGPATKLAVALLLHPLVYESGSTCLRGLMGRKAGSKNTPFKQHFALFFYESFMALVRRFLLVDMGSARLTTLAIMLTAVEEMVLRSTLVGRDQFFNRRVLGRPAFPPAVRSNKLKVRV